MMELRTALQHDSTVPNSTFVNYQVYVQYATCYLLSYRYVPLRRAAAETYGVVLCVRTVYSFQYSLAFRRLTNVPRIEVARTEST